MFQAAQINHNPLYSNGVGVKNGSNIIFSEESKETKINSFGFKVDSEKLIELGAELQEEAKKFLNAHKKYKKAFFSELDNEVSDHISFITFCKVYIVDNLWLKQWKKFVNMKIVKRNLYLSHAVAY